MAESIPQVVLPVIQAPEILLSSLANVALLEQPQTDHLKSAFESFNHLSTQLTESYALLENRVADLTSELNVVSEQRMQELQGKELVANRLESLINFLPGGVIVLDQRGIIVDINPTAVSMLDDGLKGQLWREVIQRCFSPKSDDGHEVSNHQGKRINIATRSLDKDGQIILLTDQTETRKLQSELSRHERLTALGKMVSTLAHQVRTPLSSAMLYASHLLNTSLSSQQHHQFSQKLLNRLHEMERQVRDMLLFVKADMVIKDQLTIAELQQQLAETMEMSLHQHSIHCSWEIKNNDRLIRCNSDALIGALSNLVNNSVQAMGEGGELLISFECDSTGQLIILINDNGDGISEEIKKQVHELFYTTKPQGTGIGLAVVNTVVNSHGGKFYLTPNAIQGVCARLELPICMVPEATVGSQKYAY
ncbi:MAG: two-component system sensor histidine kinase FlrB [Candidatus Endobugula sp.]|jgi:two-component system sensor histidine kinase FlrB